MVKGLKKGETTIVVTTQDGGKTATCNVSVGEYVPVSEVSLFRELLLEVGAGYQMKAYVLPANASNKSVTWESSDPEIATIDQNGVIKALKEGKINITATSRENNEISGECYLEVVSKSEVAKINQEAAKHGYITMVTRKNITNQKLFLQIGVASESDKANVWIDFNNNGEKDEGENNIKFTGQKEPYAFTSQVITLYGKVTLLDCSENVLTRLDVSKNLELKSLYCRENPLIQLDVTKNTNLENLVCRLNQLLTELDVSKNAKLTDLSCGGNSLTRLNVSQNKELTYLSCEENLLTQLNVTNNEKLGYLSFERNQLTEVDISQNKLLIELYCRNNQFTQKAMDNLLDNLPHIDSEDGAEAYLIGDEEDPHRQINISEQQKQKAKEKKWSLYVVVDGNDQLINP